MPEKKKKSTASIITETFAGKPIPGGPSSTAFQRVINVLRDVIGKTEKGKRKKKSQAERLFE